MLINSLLQSPNTHEHTNCSTWENCPLASAELKSRETELDRKYEESTSTSKSFAIDPSVVFVVFRADNGNCIVVLSRGLKEHEKGEEVLSCSQTVEQADSPGIGSLGKGTSLSSRSAVRGQWNDSFSAATLLLRSSHPYLPLIPSHL
nr:hypothetical protein HmN_000938200 [Hymenolepis microstoma]